MEILDTIHNQTIKAVIFGSIWFIAVGLPVLLQPAGPKLKEQFNNLHLLRIFGAVSDFFFALEIVANCFLCKIFYFLISLWSGQPCRN